MANKHVSRCETSYVISQLNPQWHTTTHLLEWQTPKHLTIANVDRAARTLFHCWWECRMVQPTWKTVWQFLTKLKSLTTLSSNGAPWYLYPREFKTYVHTKMCTRIYIAALLRIARSGKLPRCCAVGEWINKLWCIRAMGSYLVLKRDELFSHEKTWRKCKLLSERSQSEKLHIIWFQLYDILEKA